MFLISIATSPSETGCILHWNNCLKFSCRHNRLPLSASVHVGVNCPSVTPSNLIQLFQWSLCLKHQLRECKTLKKPCLYLNSNYILAAQCLLDMVVLSRKVRKTIWHLLQILNRIYLFQLSTASWKVVKNTGNTENGWILSPVPLEIGGKNRFWETITESEMKDG